MVEKENIRAKLDLREGIKKFKENLIKSGWEDDEVNEKITEVFANFPFYKYTGKQKTSWISRFGKLLIYLLIAYLAFNAVLERNRRWKKVVDDLYHDNEIGYQITRVMRFMALPIFKVYDLSKFHDRACLIDNPFKIKDDLLCELCEKISEIKHEEYDSNSKEEIKNDQPVIFKNLPYYTDMNIGFNDFKELFRLHHHEMDSNICDISLNNEFESVSDFFKLTEEEVVQRNLSISWINCHTYGTRFYRKLFPRPEFVEKSSEIAFEKTVMILQNGRNVTVAPSNLVSTDFVFLVQVKGKSNINLMMPKDCQGICKHDALRGTLVEGEIFVYPANLWDVTVVGAEENGLSIVFQSMYTV